MPRLFVESLEEYRDRYAMKKIGYARVLAEKVNAGKIGLDEFYYKIKKEDNLMESDLEHYARAKAEMYLKALIGSILDDVNNPESLENWWKTLTTGLKELHVYELVEKDLEKIENMLMKYKQRIILNRKALVDVINDEDAVKEGPYAFWKWFIRQVNETRKGERKMFLDTKDRIKEMVIRRSEAIVTKILSSLKNFDQIVELCYRVHEDLSPFVTEERVGMELYKYVISNEFMKDTETLLHAYFFEKKIERDWKKRGCKLLREKNRILSISKTKMRRKKAPGEVIEKEAEIDHSLEMDDFSFAYKMIAKMDDEAFLYESTPYLYKVFIDIRGGIERKVVLAKKLAEELYTNIKDKLDKGAEYNRDLLLNIDRKELSRLIKKQYTDKELHELMRPKDPKYHLGERAEEVLRAAIYWLEVNYLRYNPKKAAEVLDSKVKLFF